MKYEIHDIRNFVLVSSASLLLLGSAISSPLIDVQTNFITQNFVLTLALISLFFYASIFFGLATPSTARCVKVKKINLQIIFYVLCASLIIAKFTDRFYLRQVENLISIASVRMARETESNLFSMYSALIFPFISIGYFKISRNLSSFGRWLFYIAALSSSIDILISGSRGIMVVLCVVYFGSLISKRNFLLILIILISALGFAFEIRVDELHASSPAVEIMYLFGKSGYAEFVQMSTLAMRGLMVEELSSLFFWFIHLNQYLAHGVFEFAYLFSVSPQVSFNPQHLIPHTSFLGFDEIKLERNNLYYTLFGSIYVSFGHAAPVIAGIVGFWLGVLLKRSKLVSLNAHRLVCLTIFMAPFVNSLGGFDIYLFLISTHIWSRITIS